MVLHLIRRFSRFLAFIFSVTHLTHTPYSHTLLTHLNPMLYESFNNTQFILIYIMFLEVDTHTPPLPLLLTAIFGLKCV